jgi:spermidine synthase
MFLMKYFTRASTKNGNIAVYKPLLGPWQVSVKDCGQTTLYTNAMWVNAFKRLRPLFHKRRVERVLMLGLGAGGQIKTINEAFPGSALTVVEYDEQMVALARELELYRPYPFPHVILDDAKNAVHALDEQFDLIILDLFDGPEPSPLAEDEVFMTRLMSLLSPQGVMLANVYQRAEYLSLPQQLYANSNIWKFRLNTLGAFWQETK